jgi:tRNA (cytidine/uridine-2'-O-)-methyltransferase
VVNLSKPVIFTHLPIYSSLHPFIAMQIALYQPDIPQNLGAFIRLSACLGTKLHVIEPCGFPLDERKIRRAAMDYYDKAQMMRHGGWEEFRIWNQESGNRLILLTTKAAVDYRTIAYQPNDILLLGRESAGVPDEVHETADLRVMIPMAQGCRSLNVTLAAAMVLGRGLNG